MPRSTEFSDEGPKEREGGAVADWEAEQYRNNRPGSATGGLNVLDWWGYVFQECRGKKEKIYH